MAVALRASDRRALPDGPRRVHPVYNGGDTELFVVGAAFRIRHRIAMETGRDRLVLGSVRQQVARELLNRELVEGEVVVERLDDPVAIPPHGPIRVRFVPLRVRITRQVKPHRGPPFAEVRRRQQRIDQSFVPRPFLPVTTRRFDLLRRRRNPDQVQADSPGQRRTFGFWRRLQMLRIEAGEDEAVHVVRRPRGVGDLWQRRRDRLHVGPVGFPLRSLGNPSAQRVDFRALERSTPLWHPFMRVRMRDAMNQFARTNIAGHDR